MAGHYAVLGVSSTATTEEIRAAYKKLAIQHHPDKGGDTSRFILIQKAMEVLTDPVRRTRFDAGQDESQSLDNHNDTGRHGHHKHKGDSSRHRQDHYSSYEETPEQNQPRKADDKEAPPQPESPQTDEYSRTRSQSIKSLRELESHALYNYGLNEHLRVELRQYKSARNFPETWCQLNNFRRRLATRHSTAEQLST
ncbi:hypothetical protein RBB50_000200 [Rhinocladiella similis]